MRHFMTPLRALAWVTLLYAAGCEDDTLASEAPRIRVIPEPEGSQLSLAAPVGIDLGQVPLYGQGQARFRIANDAATVLRIDGATLSNTSGGSFTIDKVSTTVAAYAEDGELRVSFVPSAADQVGEATVILATNAGEAGNLQVAVRIRGVGLWVGAPVLRVCYAGACYPTGPCPDRGDGLTECRIVEQPSK